MFNTPVKIIIALVVIGGVLTTAVIFIGDWWKHPDKINPVAAQYLKAARFWHSQSARKDSIIADKEAVIRIFQDQVKSAQGYADTYKTQRDSSFRAGKAALSGMSTAEKMKAYFQRLYQNMTLSRPAGDKQPELTSDEVITAGLQTADQEAFLSHANDSLVIAAATYKATNDRLRIGLRTASGKLSAVGQTATSKASRGGLWPFNRRRKKELRVVAQQAQQAAIEVEKTSDLEQEVNNQLNTNQP